MEPNSSVAEAHAVAHSVEHAEGAEGDEGTEVPRGPAVRAHIGHMQFEVPIGDGQQSMKWLSMTIVMRHHALSDARAAPRQRERKGRMPGIFLPSAIHGGEHMREDGSGAATHGRHFCNPNPKVHTAHAAPCARGNQRRGIMTSHRPWTTACCCQSVVPR